MTFPNLPPNEIIEWMLSPRKYKEGAIVLCDMNDAPLQKVLFATAACIGMDIKLTEEAKRMLEFKGFTPKYGARQVSGIIRNYLRRPISRMILTGELKNGYTLCGSLSSNGEELKWRVLRLMNK